MTFFLKCYDQTLEWAKHRYASRYLALLSFVEASFFPIPPDVMLAPMALANRAAAFRFAGVATFFSVFGGLLGYAIGFFAFQTIGMPFIEYCGYTHGYEIVLDWFQTWGFWAVLLAGITPIPYKLFTICSGVMQFSLPLFLIASIMGRAIRFYLVALLIRFGGETMEIKLRSLVARFGWILLFIVCLGLGIKFFV